MPTRNVVITDHQAAMVERLVAEGRYQNASEVLREGLRLVEEREGLQERRLRAFDAAIAEGEAALLAGDVVTIGSDEDLDAFMRSLRPE
jgi:antitoxin ParD1/3/4